MASQLRVYVPDHPLIKHWLGFTRDASTPPVLFKTAIAKNIGKMKILRERNHL